MGGARRLLVVILSSVVMMSQPLSASGHSAGTYYPRFWNSEDLPIIEWRFTAEFTGKDRRSRILDAQDQWNAVTDVNMSFGWNTSDYGNYLAQETCDQPEDKNGIHWEELRTAFGATHRCVRNDGSLVNFAMVFDSLEVWNTGTDDPTKNEVDLWHVATHEVGHATGWTPEFTGKDTCPDAKFVDWQTMCDSVPALVGQPEEGKKFRRSLAALRIGLKYARTKRLRRSP